MRSTLLLAALVLVPALHAGSAKADWKEIEKTVKLTPGIDPEATGDDQDTFNLLTLINAQTDQFIAAHPTDPRRWDAEVLKLQVAVQSARIGGAEVDWAAHEKGFAAILAAREAKPATKVAAQTGWFLARVHRLSAAGDSAGLSAVARDVEAFYDQHRRGQQVAGMALFVANRIGRTDPARAAAMLKKIAGEGEGELPAEAAKLLRLLNARQKPLELSFTALDGRKVDVAALRGKVVLIDFWATWCPPCREETPTVVEAYRRLHAQGFEIVGISLDEGRDKLTAYLGKFEMPWPQYFDGQGWDNQLAGRFEIQSIPAMWLLNKRGYLVDVDGRDDLERKVKRLLAE